MAKALAASGAMREHSRPKRHNWHWRIDQSGAVTAAIRDKRQGGVKQAPREDARDTWVF
jgi:hypothetical protein